MRNSGLDINVTAGVTGIKFRNNCLKLFIKCILELVQQRVFVQGGKREDSSSHPKVCR